MTQGQSRPQRKSRDPSSTPSPSAPPTPVKPQPRSAPETTYTSSSTINSHENHHRPEPANPTPLPAVGTTDRTRGLALPSTRRRAHPPNRLGAPSLETGPRRSGTRPGPGYPHAPTLTGSAPHRPGRASQGHRRPPRPHLSTNRPQRLRPPLRRSRQGCRSTTRCTDRVRASAPTGTRRRPQAWTLNCRATSRKRRSCSLTRPS